MRWARTYSLVLIIESVQRSLGSFISELNLTYSVFGSPRATSCAMSTSCGGASPVAARASRNMVLQKGHAVAMVVAPVATSSAARLWLTLWPDSSPRNARPPPAPQQKLRSWLRGASTSWPDWATMARGWSYTFAIAADIAGVVEDDLFGLRSVGHSGQKPLLIWAGVDVRAEARTLLSVGRWLQGLRGLKPASIFRLLWHD